MSKRMNTARAGVALLGVGAVVAASVLPGTIATAEETGDVESAVTRAVLIQGDANGEISRATLVTQINLDGQGQANFTIPVAEGSSPKNMDSFGSPTVVDGQAQYDIDVNGPQTFRTSQTYPQDQIPVSVTAEAELDGQPIAPADLAGQTGLAKLTYTFTNNSGEPTQLTYKDALGNTITEERDIPVPMAASTTIEFDPSWQEISSPKASVVSGNGSGDTLVSATSAMLPDSLPGQETTQTLEIEARITDAVVPPADIKVAVLNPSKSPDLQEGITTGEEGAELAATLTDAGTQLADGASQLESGLQTAADGAQQIADGVNGTLAPGLIALNVQGIGALREAGATLPETVRSSPDFSQITDGFAAIRAANEGVRDGLGVYKTKSSQKPGPWIKKNGDVDTGRADVARTLWALVYGARTIDIPTDSKNPNNIPNTNNGGLTNPLCDPDDPRNAKNPCGAFQIIDQVATGLSDTLIPNLEQLLSSGPKEISDNLTGTGAVGVNALAGSLGCTVVQKGDPAAKAGQTGPIVTGCTTPVIVNGQDVSGTVNLVLPLLTQSFYNPLKLNGITPDPSSGLAAVLGQFYPGAWATAVEPGIKEAADGLVELNGVITTRKDGYPDLDTNKKTTATGIVMQTRNSLALGGVGKSLYPGGRCEGYARTGVPSSGPNTEADPDRVEQTCAAADVLNIAVMGTDLLEEGVSFTLLEGISEQLLAGVGSYSPGCEPTATLACAVGTITVGVTDTLGPGTQQLADGLPAAVEGAGKIKTDGGEALQKQGNEGSKQAGLALATFEALQSRVDSGAGIPGGAPEGVDDVNGVYAFAFDGAGGTATENAARAGLALLALIAAGGVGAVLGNRASGG
ncbi:MAG: hypothetical protein V9E98_11145 [Candidatus Nanopelagicales bacterium]